MLNRKYSTDEDFSDCEDQSSSVGLSSTSLNRSLIEVNNSSSEKASCSTNYTATDEISTNSTEISTNWKQWDKSNNLMKVDSIKNSHILEEKCL